MDFLKSWNSQWLVHILPTGSLWKITWRYLVKMLICRPHSVEWVSVIDILWRSTFSYFFRAKDKNHLFSEGFPAPPQLPDVSSSSSALHSMSAYLPWCSENILACREVLYILLFLPLYLQNKAPISNFPSCPP